MKLHLLLLILCICTTQKFYSQEDDGVVSLTIPTRNSLTFNRYTINPTFSFVREQTKYISIYNKREWVNFENAPLTYLASYSGRFGENIGAGFGLFQQNYGVLTTFGGILNFAYNARLGRDSNLTFGLNIGAYKSGLNTANVITNFDDPSLQNVPENFLLTINPGINYGTEFLDFGVSVNNLALYNFESSELIQDNPQQSLQAHFMYTGYMNSRGFFDNSKFTGLIRSEFQKEETIISALAMITVPKGIWGQVGYNTRFGASAGIGINITSQIAIEYNFETAFGDLQLLGPSHEISLAYRFKNNDYYDYSNDDEVTGILSGSKKKRRVTQPKKSTTASRKVAQDAKNKRDSEAKAKLVAAQNVRKEKEEKDKVLAEEKAIEAINNEAKLLEEQNAKTQADKKAKEIAETRAKILEDQKAKQAVETAKRLKEAQEAKKQSEANAKIAADQIAKDEAEAQLIKEEKAKEDAKLLAEKNAKDAIQKQAKLLAEQKAKEEANANALLIAEQKVIEAAKAAEKLLAEQKLKESEEAEAKTLEEETKEDLIANPKDELGKSMQVLAKQNEEANTAQNELLKQFDEIVAIKDKDLKDLKEENDLSDKGIVVKPRPFKSITAENNALNAIMSDLDTSIGQRNKQIEDLQSLYDESTKIGNTDLDEVNLFYKKKIKRLTEEQLNAVQTRAQLKAKLETIKIATDFEKRRRIKRAAFDNQEDRYSQDRALLKTIKESTQLSDEPFKAEDFDNGEDQGNSIKILKNIKNVENGYYAVVAVHSNAKKRDDFITKMVASGRTDVDFFYDVSTSKYYIYYNKYNDIQNATEVLKTKGNRPYNQKMSIIKIEN